MLLKKKMIENWKWWWWSSSLNSHFRHFSSLVLFHFILPRYGIFICRPLSPFRNFFYFLLNNLFVIGLIIFFKIFYQVVLTFKKVAKFFFSFLTRLYKPHSNKHFKQFFLRSKTIHAFVACAWTSFNLNLKKEKKDKKKRAQPYKEEKVGMYFHR